MPPIIPNDTLVVTPRASACADRALTIVSGREAPALALPSSAEPASTAVSPFWLSGPCPAWCGAEHEDADSYEDRYHYLMGADVELALYEESYGGERGPGHLNAAVEQHYRAAAPEIYLAVPRTEPRRPHLVIGEDTVMMTLAEARALRDRLTKLLDATDEDRRGPGGVAAVPGACAPWCAQHSTYGDACFSRELVLNVRGSSTGGVRETRFMLALADDDASISVQRDGADALDLDPAHAEAVAHALLAMAAEYHGDRDAAQLHRDAAAGTAVTR